MWILAIVTCQNISHGILCLIYVYNKHISSQGNIKLKTHGWDGIMICKIQLVTKMHFNNRIYWLGIVFSVLFMPMELHAATLPHCITNYGIDSKMHCDKIHFTRNKFWLAREIISVISMRPYIPVNAYISYDGIKNCIWILDFVQKYISIQRYFVSIWDFL